MHKTGFIAVFEKGIAWLASFPPSSGRSSQRNITISTPLSPNGVKVNEEELEAENQLGGTRNTFS